MSLVLQSSAGGQVTLNEPTTASNFTLSLPATTGTLITSGDAATVTPNMLAEPLTRTVNFATTSGTSVDITAIPSWASRITLLFNGVSTSGTSIKLIRLGSSSGGVETSGYAASAITGTASASWYLNSTAGFPIQVSGTAGAANLCSGAVVFYNPTGNTWIAQGVVHTEGGSTQSIGSAVSGAKTLSSTLDRIRITATNGTDTFDAGSISLMYEGGI